jgi:hypothetical protein
LFRCLFQSEILPAVRWSYKIEGDEFVFTDSPKYFEEALREPDKKETASEKEKKAKP